MSAQELRKFFLEFFKEKEHVIIPSASLIPEHDPTVLFTTAGMHPLTPYLLGEKHPAGRRLTNFQKCLRTGDIDSVGDDSHLTFFEMLGNWSLGDPTSPDGIGEAGYFKKEAIEWSWEFLTSPKRLGLDKNKIAVSVFAGDDDSPFDEESFNLWKKLGLPQERIVKLQKENNWWGPVGETGPCGPDTEIFYWTGEGKAPKNFDFTDEQWAEIWNDVFMEFNKRKDGTYEPLKQKNVDTGMGLERALATINGKKNVYETELFLPIIQKIEKLSGKKYNDYKKEMRIIADHIKASVFIIADGVEPSNTGRGYVLRKLIRRARYYYDYLKYGALKIDESFVWQLVECITLIYKDIYGELNAKKDKVDEVIRDEEMTFIAHLRFGRKFLEKIIRTENYISGENAFLLYSTYGYPFELILDIAKEMDVKVDIRGFQEKKEQHQELSRTASAGMFKGGLSEAGEQTTKYHTATHLLLATLRQILGEHVIQKGSNITAERLRFDFLHQEKMTQEQIKDVENLVNQKIKENLEVEVEEMDLEEAKASGAMGIFEYKYGERVAVYTIKNQQTGEIFSREICGGPHVKRTSELGNFKIIKEEASSAGVRRIKAVLE